MTALLDSTTEQTNLETLGEQLAHDVTATIQKLPAARPSRKELLFGRKDDVPGIKLFRILFVLIPYLAVHVFLYAAWAIIGFLVWVPMLTRMMMAFFAAILSSVLTGRDPSHAERLLEFAIGFYTRGFSLITQSFQGGVVTPPNPAPIELHLRRLLMELAFSVAFWVGIFITWQGFLAVHTGSLFAR